MDKLKQNNKNNSKNVKNKDDLSSKQQDYSYDFVPTLNEWVTIDDQKKKAKELEDI